NCPAGKARATAHARISARCGYSWKCRGGRRTLVVLEGGRMKGKLKLAANKKTWLLVREDGKEMQVPAKALTRSLFPLNQQTHDGLEVEYELDKGLPAKIY